MKTKFKKKSKAYIYATHAELGTFLTKVTIKKHRVVRGQVTALIEFTEQKIDPIWVKEEELYSSLNVMERTVINKLKDQFRRSLTHIKQEFDKER